MKTPQRVAEHLFSWSEGCDPLHVNTVILFKGGGERKENIQAG